MEKMTVAEIAKAVGGKLLCGDGNTEVSYVCIDSRDAHEGALFVPIIGERVDAHKFIGQVFEQGAAAVFTSRGEIVDNTKPHILVEQTEKALGQLAVYYKSRFQIPVVGITGSVGKTSTKEMIAAALSTKYDVLKTAGNQNSNIGVPLTLFRIEKHHQIAVIEMGISDFDEMAELAEFARPDTDVVTNIGVAHLAQFKTRENIMKEKLQIARFFTKENKLFINGDNDMMAQINPENMTADVEFFGTDKNMAYHAEDICIEDGRQCFTFVGGGYTQRVRMLQLGLHNVYNGVVALAVALQYGIEPAQAKVGVENYTGIAMRQQVNHMKDGIKIIDDTYNASPDSIRSAVEVLVSLDNTGRKIACLADVLELGDTSWQCHYDTGVAIANTGIDELVTVGEMAKAYAKGVNDTNASVVTHSFDNNAEAAAYLETVISAGDALMCKGSRGMHQEEIVEHMIKILKSAKKSSILMND